MTEESPLPPNTCPPTPRDPYGLNFIRIWSEEEGTTRFRLLRKLAVVAVLAAVYFVAGKLGLKLAFAHPSATAVWPPTGIALAALLVLGYRVWPGILLGAFLVNLTTAGSVATSIGIAAGNTLEGLVGAYLVNNFTGGRNVFDRAQDTLKFAILAGMLSTTISPTFGVTSLSLGGFTSWANYGSIWLTWWLGDAVGALVVAPLLLLWSAHPRVRWNPGWALEAVVLLQCLFLVGLAVFGGLFPFQSKNYPLEFLCIPFLIWAAFRFGPREAAIAILVLSAVGIRGTLHGFGPFVRETQNESLMLLQAFMGVIATMTMVLAGVASERKRAAERFRLVVESAPNAIVMVGQQGKIALMNSQAEMLFGYKREELVGRSVEILVPERFRSEHPAYRKRFFAQPQARPMGAGRDLYAVRKDGSEFPVEIGLNPIETEEGSQVLSAIVDITERRRAEEALRRAYGELELQVQHRTKELSKAIESLQVEITERKLAEDKLARTNDELTATNKELEAFTYSASHDLRAPLRHIDGFSKILIEEYGAQLDSDAQHCLQRIEKGARQMGRLVDDLLNLGRMGRQAVSPQPTALKSLVLEVMTELKPETADREIEWRIGDLPVVECDTGLMKLVFANLLSNAIKFTRPQKHTIIEVGQMTAEGQPVIFVRDNGIGFNMRYVDKLFGIFQRLHREEDFEGTGVGLANVQRIIQKHGGRVWAEAEPYKGATFYFTVAGPAAQEPETGAPSEVEHDRQ